MKKEERAAYQREYRKRVKEDADLQEQETDSDPNLCKRSKQTVNSGQENVNSLRGDVNKPVNWEAEARQLRREVEALQAEVARLKQLLAQRPKIEGPEIRVPTGFTVPLSKAMQARGHMPDNSPMGRMFRGEA